MKKPVLYVADLQELREQFEKFPVTMRRPAVCVSDEYTEAEIFDSEVQSIFDHLADKQLAPELLTRYTEGFIDNFETELEEDPELVKSSLHMAVDYAWCLKRLGESLIKFFDENQLYDHNQKLIGECQGVAQGRWLVMRRDPPKFEYPVHK